MECFSFILALERKKSATSYLIFIYFFQKKTDRSFPSSKSIDVFDNFQVDNMLSTCRISDCAPETSWSTTLAGIFSFSLQATWTITDATPDCDSLESYSQNPRSNVRNLGPKIYKYKQSRLLLEAITHFWKGIAKVVEIRGLSFCACRSFAIQMIGIWKKAKKFTLWHKNWQKRLWNLGFFD